MSLIKKYPMLGSSVDPEKISLTLKSLIPLILLITASFHLDITETMLEETVSAIGAIITAGVTVYGIWRKVK